MELAAPLFVLELEKADARADLATASRVDHALRMLHTDGMHAALEFMQLMRVPRDVTHRVLLSRSRCRKPAEQQASR